MPRPFFSLSVLAVAGMALAGCTEVMDSLSRADARLSELSQRSPDPVAQAAADWDAGLADQAVSRLRPAAEAGDADAQFLLGLALTTGRGVDQADPVAGTGWFRQAADQGHVEASHMLGIALLSGRGVTADAAAARRWFDAAAGQGHTGALFQAGLMRMQGRGGPAAPADGLTLVEQAGEAGNPEAQLVLGRIHAEGQGVPAVNPAWAARWLGKAARQGVPEAQHRLGAHFIAGRGVPADMVRGLAWLSVAERAGLEAAAAPRKALSTRLGAAQQAQAAILAVRLPGEPVGGRTDGPSVLFVQVALDRLGHAPGPLDGVMGPGTTAALRTWQRDAGLTPDGVIGPRTLAALKTATDGR